MSEAIRYLNNAKEILRKAKIEDNMYVDVKYVQEACGTVYLAVLKAIDEYLINKGISEAKLPQSIEGYREMMKKHLSIHNGKLTREFEVLYDELHIAGNYRGLHLNANIIKEIFKLARIFIEKIG